MSKELPLGSSPLSLLQALRGEVISAQLAYPEILHMEVKDSEGGIWRFATQDADWLPEDPAEISGRVIEDVHLYSQGQLQFDFTDGSKLDVIPAAFEIDDPPHWQLFAPGHIFLSFGPGSRWHINSSH